MSVFRSKYIGFSIVLMLATRKCVGDFTLNSCLSLSPEPPLPESSAPTPVTISLDATQFYAKNQDITVTLSTSSGDIKDFIVQARQIDYGTDPSGSFGADSTVATLTCSTKHDTAINADRSTKTSVTLTWTPPRTEGGRIFIVASVVDSSDNFWSSFSSIVLNPDYANSYIVINVGTDIPWSSSWSNEKSDQVSNLITSVESQLEQQTWLPYVTKVRVLGVSNDGNTITINIRSDLRKGHPTVWDEAVIGTQVWEWSVQPILPGGGSVTSVQQKSSYATSPDGYVTITSPCSLLDTAQECEKRNKVCSSISLQPACVCPTNDPKCDDDDVGSGEGDATRRGTCPRPSGSCNSNANLCQDDYDCATGMLCCSNACGGTECVDAVNGPDDVPIRLSGGGFNSGRVEIQYNGEWRTVCATNNIDEYTVNVMCKQLKFGGAGESVTPVKDAFPETGSYIWLKDVQCAGLENQVGHCQSDGWGNVDSCNHDEDVGLYCDITDDTICIEFVVGQAWNPAYADTTSTEYASISQSIEDMVTSAATDSKRSATSTQVVKLSDSGGNIKAEVCVTYDSALTPPDQTEVTLSLRDNIENGGGTLPLDGNQVPITDLQFDYDTENPLNVPIDSSTAVCAIYDTMSICQHSGICIDQNGTPACSCVGNYTGDFCLAKETPEDLAVTLTSDAYAYGVLEVTSPSGTEAAVCDTSWTDKNSDVVCRQLGFSQGGTRVVLSNITYSASTRLDYVQCTGSEKNIGWCSKPDFNDYSCPDENQVVILCNDVTDTLKYGLTLSSDFDPDLNDATSQKYQDLKDQIENELGNKYGSDATVNVVGFEPDNGKTKAIVEVTYPNKQLDVKSQSKEALGLQYSLLRSSSITATELIVDKPRNDKTWTMPIDFNTDLCELFRRKKSCVNGAVCQVVDSNPECSCPAGYNGTDCSEDVDECASSSLNECAQICTNTVGSFTCSCQDGYRSIDNGRICDYDGLDVQLADGSAFGGELQVSNQDSWGTVCLDQFTMLDADVACRQLGKQPFTVFDAGPILPPNTVPQTIAYLKCTGTETNINQCPRSVWGDLSCSSGKKVGLLCRDTKRHIPTQLQLDLQWQNSKYTDNSDPDVQQLKADLSNVIQEIMNTFNNSGNSAATFTNLVTNDFEEYGGKATLNLDVAFKNEIDLEEQAALGLFLVNELKKRNNVIARASNNPGVPVINILLVTDTAAGRDMRVSATQASDQCFLLDAKKGCLSGGKCMVNSGGDAVCNCLAKRNDRGGTYCQEVTDPKSPTATNVTSEDLHVLAYRLDLNWLQIYFDSSASATQNLKNNLIAMSNTLYNSNKFYPTSTVVANLKPGSVDATISAMFDHILTPTHQAQMASAIINSIADFGYQVPFNGTLIELLGPLRIIYEGPFLGTIEEVPVVTTCSIYDDRELCMRGGVCVSRANFTPSCVCVGSYSGEFCEFDPTEKISPSTPNLETRRLLIIILCVIGGILLLFVILLCALLCNHKRNIKHESSMSDSDSDAYSTRSFAAIRPGYGYGFGNAYGPMGNAYGTMGIHRPMQSTWTPEHWGTTPGDPTYMASANAAFDDAYNYSRGDMNYPWGRPAIMASRGISGGAANVLRRHSALNERDYF